MKRSGCKTVIGLLIVQAVFVLSTSAVAADLEKKFNKEFSTPGKELLKVSNHYGDVIVESWNQDKVVIDVIVTVKHPNEAKAEKLLSMIEVIFSENDNTIEARTDIEGRFSFNNIGNDREFSINYVIKMPVDFNLDLTNRYGAVKIDELSGHVDLKVRYGSLLVDKLSRGKVKPLNRISLAYSKGEIAEAGWAELSIRYNSASIETAQALLIDSRYAKIEIGEVSSVVMDSRYDHLTINYVNNIVAESGYTAFTIENLKSKMDIQANYGSLAVNNIESGFELIQVKSGYCPVKLDIEDGAGYKLNIDASYASVKFDEENAEIIQRIYENTSKTLEAVIGVDSGSKVILTTKHGSVKVF